MLNGHKHIFMEHLTGAFEAGYTNAATSLSQMIKDKISFNNFHFGFHKLDSDSFNGKTAFSRNGTNLLLTTEIFGDVTGKSYLMFSDYEFEFLTGSIPDRLGINLKDEFLKELDNILSASVITKLSNHLNCKMYGDVPMLIGRVSTKIENLIHDDFSENAEEVYVNSIRFTSVSNPAVNPHFIWVIDTSPLKVEAMKIA